MFEVILLLGYLQCVSQANQLKANSVSTEKKNSEAFRLGCKLMDVSALEIIRAGLQVVLKYIESLAGGRVVYRESLSMLLLCFINNSIKLFLAII